MPLYIWGIVLMPIGAFFMFIEDAFSWEQAKGLLILLIGLAVLIHDVRKRTMDAESED
jgi:hypothetical protein